VTHGEADYDVIVVGAGIGGIYAVHRFTHQGLSVLGVEGASGVGGVWYHNRYPGARVDVDSIDYCYYFSTEIWQQWRWTERFAAQPEILAYLDFVADSFGVKQRFVFGTWVTSAQWRGDTARYHVTTSTGLSVSCRFLVMATGQLSAARRPEFPGLERFRGEWVRTSHWPERGVDLDGRRIGIIGTGSSGVQAIPVLAQHAKRLHVFQRTANYVVPARTAPIGAAVQRGIAGRLGDERELLLATRGGTRLPVGARPLSHFSPADQVAILERQWESGGQAMNSLFSDQGTNQESNDVVAEFVRRKVREIVRDPGLAEKLCPSSYPIGTRRLCLDMGYYDTFNRDNVTLIDLRSDPITEITETGIRTQAAHHELDLIVFALGFRAFTGALDQAHIRNERGAAPSDGWARGPRTLLGLMTTGFPNLFLPTGPGSPSVLGNLFLQNEFLMDWIGDCIGYLDAHGFATIEPSEAAQDAWTAQVAEAASRLLRLRVDNYMVHVNADDQSRVFMPYTGGFDRYVRAARDTAARGYEGFVLS
jgi:cation diffusion facilitator CzcD-associated flavoprotein CzcO